MTRRFADAACSCSPRAAGRLRPRHTTTPGRAGGAAQDFNAVVGAICRQPGWAEASRYGRDLLASNTTTALTDWALAGYNDARKFVPLPVVPRRNVQAIWDGLDALLRLCAGRAAGWQQPVLRTLATAIDIVGSPAASVPLYGAAAAVGSSGLLADAIGVAVTGWIGGAMAAVVGLAEVLLATGVPEQLRALARTIDAEEAEAGATKTTGRLPLPTWNYPTHPSTSKTTATEGGGAALAIGGIGAALLLLKGLL